MQYIYDSSLFIRDYRSRKSQGASDPSGHGRELILSGDGFKLRKKKKKIKQNKQRRYIETGERSLREEKKGKKFAIVFPKTIITQCSLAVATRFNCSDSIYIVLCFEHDSRRNKADAAVARDVQFEPVSRFINDSITDIAIN